MSRAADPVIRPLAPPDRRWVRERLVQDWTSTSVARRGELIDATGLSGYVALLGGRRTGLVYQHVGMDLCAFDRYAVRAARELKPTLPLRDRAGLPIDHELELEILIGS